MSITSELVESLLIEAEGKAASLEEQLQQANAALNAERFSHAETKSQIGAAIERERAAQETAKEATARLEIIESKLADAHQQNAALRGQLETTATELKALKAKPAISPSPKPKPEFDVVVTKTNEMGRIRGVRVKML